VNACHRCRGELKPLRAGAGPTGSDVRFEHAEPRAPSEFGQSDKTRNSSVDPPLLWGAEARTRDLPSAPERSAQGSHPATWPPARYWKPEWASPNTFLTQPFRVRCPRSYVAIASLARLFAIRGDVKIGAYAVRADVGGW